MHAPKTWAAALAALCLCAAGFAAGPILEGVPAARGEINWSDGVLRATGHGVRPIDAQSPAQARLLARRAAIADAYRNLAHLISEVRVSANTTVERYVVSSDTVRMNVEAYVRGARVVAEEDSADGVYTVTLQVGMTGREALTGIVLPSALQSAASQPVQISTQPEPVAAPQPVSRPLHNLETELLTPAAAEGPFTGLIIDARGLNIQPAMSPRILDETGKEVYGTMNIDPDVVEESGVVGYMGTIRASSGIARVGSRPLIIRATGSPDAFRQYVTISSADAQRVLSENASARFLEKCAVVLVIDERQARDEAR